MSIFSRRIDKKPLGIYVHIPFCKSKCQYCDFYSLACKDDNLMDSYELVPTDVQEKLMKEFEAKENKDD